MECSLVFVGQSIHRRGLVRVNRRVTEVQGRAMSVIYSLKEIEAGAVSISTAEAERLKERGERLYDEMLRDMLEPHHVGKFLLIEPDSGRYFVNKDSVAVIREAHAAIPDKRFYGLRVGYETEHAIGTTLKCRR